MKIQSPNDTACKEQNTGYGNKIRSITIDNMKGIGILLVVLGHISTPEPLKKVIYAFHMPLFFMISGYCFNSQKEIAKSFYIFFVEKVKRLYLPAIFIGLSCSLLSLATKQINSFNDFLVQIFGVLYAIPLFDYTFNAASIWFLSSLICVQVYYWFIMRHFEKVNIAVLLLFCLGITISDNVIFYFPFCAQSALSGLLFFHIGQVLRTRDFINQHSPKPIFFVLSCMLLLAVTYVNPIKVQFSSNILGNLNYLLLGSFSGIYIIFCISKAVKKESPLIVFGQNTIVILGYHFWVFLVVYSLSEKLGLSPSLIIQFSAQLIFFYCVSLLLDKTPTLNRIIQGKG